ncbi:MAG: helix-turn-helix domain-containing protein [Firmicutes bacterium]|nr:helix-turn-helix domain-containing protein [Bacillota bacterium]MBV1728451.1 helix-turn-helix domain-containing protein [Desulforudis sp.]MBV1734268.1 helix-turn-helix domain-containing protein [Desulforudis sp.]
MSDKLFTPEEAAEYLKVTRRTIYNWLLSGRLPGQKLGPKLWRIRKQDLDAMLKGKQD